MISPTQRQMAVLRFVTGFHEAKGRSPSFREVAAGMGFSATVHAFDIMDRMRQRGLVDWQRARTAKGVRVEFDLAHKPAIPRDPQGQPLYFVEVGK